MVLPHLEHIALSFLLCPAAISFIFRVASCPPPPIIPPPLVHLISSPALPSVSPSLALPHVILFLVSHSRPLPPLRLSQLVNGLITSSLFLLCFTHPSHLSTSNPFVDSFSIYLSLPGLHCLTCLPPLPPSPCVDVFPPQTSEMCLTGKQSVNTVGWAWCYCFSYSAHLMVCSADQQLQIHTHELHVPAHIWAYYCF